MRTQLPDPDTTAEYRHQDFDALLSQFKTAGSSVKVVVSAQTKTSDIKWNDMAGRLTMLVLDKEDNQIGRLFDCTLVRFTGNCGVKALSHIAFRHGGSVEAYQALLKVVESFAFHRTNCGMLIGSDNNNTTHKGATLRYIETYGTGYQHTPTTRNVNMGPNSKISLFWKDLHADKYVDYWNAA